MELSLPPAVLSAAESVLSTLPRQDPYESQTTVGSEPFVGDSVAKHMQSWFSPKIVYYDGRLACKYVHESRPPAFRPSQPVMDQLPLEWSSLSSNAGMTAKATLMQQYPTQVGFQFVLSVPVR